MILVDSCGWVEYFVGGKLSNKYEVYLNETERLVIPTVSIYEVYKKIKKEKGEETALLCIAQMKRANIIPLTENLALEAADLCLNLNLPMADAVIYATARAAKAKLITSDLHFKGMDGVELITK